MRKFLIGLLLLSLTACLFEPEGKFYKEIKEKDYSVLSINLNVADDTLYISKRTQLSYSMQAPDFTIVEVRATLNEETIYSNTALDNIIYFDPHVFGSGTYLLTLSLVVQSGTGSLADRFGVEHVQAWRSFVVIIDVTLPEPITITRLDTTDGTLTIHWDPYTRRNFESYLVVKSCSYDNYYYTDCEIEEIFSKDVSSWTDEAFVGGYVSYRIDIKVAEQYVRGVTKNYKWIPKSSFTIGPDNKATLHWDKPKFYRNTKSVLFQNPPFLASEFSDTVYLRPDDLLLGLYYNECKVTFTSAGNNQSYNFTIPHYLGDRHDYPSVRPTLYNKKDKVFYGHTSSSWTSAAVVMKENLSHLHWISTYSTYHSLAISPNGEHLITQQFANDIGTLNETDPLTLELSNQKILTTLTGFSELSVSDNGLIACRSYDENVVYKLPHYEKVFSKSSEHRPIAISASGEYLFNHSILYHFDGTAFQETGVVNNETAIVKAIFTPEEELIIAYYNGLINVLNPDNLQVIKSIQVPLNPLIELKYDEMSNRMLVTGHESFYLVNIENETFVQVPIYLWSGHISFLRGKLFIHLNGYGESYVSIDHALLE